MQYFGFWAPFFVPFRNKISKLLINKPKDGKRDSKLGEKYKLHETYCKSEVNSGTFDLADCGYLT
jgi:hypothetical protein